MNQLKEIRTKLGLTQKQMARRLGYKNTGVVCNIELGVQRIGAALGAHLETIKKYELPESELMVDLLRDVSKETGLQPGQIVGPSQKKEHVNARRLFCRKAHKDHTQTQIARFLGKHPSTVNHLINNN